MVGGAVPAEPGLFAVVSSAVLKRFFHRTIGAFFITAFVGVIAVVARLRIKAFLEFMIIPEHPKVFVLNRYDTGYPFKQRLVLIPLFVQRGLFVLDLLAHLIDRQGQLSHLIILIHAGDAGVYPVGNLSGAVN